jgi:hypothetical protein
MPNISFDIFFDQDFINISASRGKTTPKAKPEWKVRTAPKLPPKEIPTNPLSTPRPAQREKLTASRKAPSKLKDKAKPAIVDTASQTGETPKRKPPKLGPKKDSSTA